MITLISFFLLQVTDFTEPVCQLVSLQSNCSDNCSLSMWELSVEVTDAGGTGIDHVSLTQGSGTMNTSLAAGNENMTLVSYNASCCSPDVELVVVDQVGNVGYCFYTVQKKDINSTQTVPGTTTINKPQAAGSMATKPAPFFLLCFSISILASVFY